MTNHNILKECTCESTQVYNILNNKNQIKKQETISLMKTDIENAKSYQTTITSYLVAKNGDVDFIKVIEGIAASSSVKLQINSVTDESSSQASIIGAQLIDTNIIITGAWKNVEFFTAIPNSAHYLRFWDSFSPTTPTLA